MSKIKRLLPAAICVGILSQLFACGDESVDSGANTTTVNETTEAEIPDEYVFDRSFSGNTARVLNIEDIFSMHAVIDTGETNGDTLNDTQYEAVRRLEEEMGITWEETNVDLQTEFATLVPQLILSGDDEYDIIYENTRDLYNFSSQGYYYNLLDFDQIQLDEDWWLKSYNDYNVINDKMYTALGYSNLTVVDAITCLNFNQSMVEELGLELPYDYVREGTWTLDVLGTYLKAAANLNGDADFTWTDSGSCVWGATMASNAGPQWLRGCGEYSVEFENNSLVLTAGSERFYDVCDKIANMLGATDGTIYFGTYSGDDDPGSYINCFEVERAMFGSSEIAKANRMRGLEFTFGVLPFPKYDENQDRYYVGVSYPASGVSIPVTCVDTDFAAAVGDAINYIFYTDVWDVFREVTLETKNLRNDDSIEMLELILNSTYPNLTEIYGIDSTIMDEISAKLRAGDASVAWVFASHESQLKADIEEVNNQ